MLYELTAAKFSYGENQVLNLDRLQLQNGKNYAVVGANGAGKTTLLKILNGLLLLTSGTISHQGEVVKPEGSDILKRNSIYVHQTPLLFSGTVFTNVVYGLKIRGFSESERKKVGDQILEKFGLSDLSKRGSEQLSQGEIKRVAIARAVVLKPRVLLLDEPTAHLDQESAKKLIKILRQIATEYSVSIIFSSHDESFNSGLADEVIKLKRGAVLN